jgi:hypothetical protein
MAVKYADALYSFRTVSSFIGDLVSMSPDSGSLAQIETDLSSAAAAYFQRRYSDAIDSYKEAGTLIYRFLNPSILTIWPGAYSSLSRDPKLFDSLLSVAAEHMNVLPIPTPETIHPRVAPDPVVLGNPPVAQSGIRSTTLDSPAAQSAVADIQAAAHFRTLGQVTTAQFLEARAQKAAPNVAGLLKTAATHDATPAAGGANPVAGPITPSALSITNRPTGLVTTRLLAGLGLSASTLGKVANTGALQPTLPSQVLEGRTLGIVSNGATSQITWQSGDAPDITKMKAAAYVSRVNAVSLLNDALLIPQQPSDIALALPHHYYYTIPLGIAEALHAMGDYANAESYYLQAAGYQYLNQAVEVPYLFRRLASLYLDWGNSYFLDGDPASAQPVYERVIVHDGTVPATAPLYSTATLKAAADVAKQVVANIKSTPALPATINPDLIATIMGCYAALVKITNGLDYWGSAANNVPIWTFDYLQSVAINFAQLAIGAERDFINFQDRADQGALNRQQLVQTVLQSQAEVNAAQLQADAANAEVGTYQAGLDLANTRTANAQADVAAYTAMSWDQIQYQAESAQVQGGDDGDPNYLNYLADQLLSGSSIEESRGTAAAAAQLAGAKRNRDYEIGSLQRTVGDMQAAAVQAQAALNAAKASATAAQAQVTVAQLRSSGAQTMLNAFDSSFFTPDVWYAMGAAVYQLYQRYFYMAIKVAKEMQKAYNFETDQLVHWIKPSYSADEVKGLLGADVLMADIQQFTYDLVTATRSKPQPIRHAISLATSYPFLFETQFRKSGVMDFETRVDDFDASYPGTYAGRIEAIEVEVDGIVPIVGLSGTLTNSGISTYRIPSDALPPDPHAPGVKYRVQPRETLVLSDYAVRDDAMMFTTDNRMLRTFQGAGVASSWHLEIPRSINDIDFGAVTDIRLTFYYRARYDQGLKTKVLAQLAALPGVTRKARSLPLRWLYPDAFYAFQAGGTLAFTLRARDFGRNETQPKLANIGVLFTTDGTKPAAGIKFSLTAPGHAAVTAQADANGVVASGAGSPLAPLVGGTAIGDYAVTMTAADNPGFVTGGKINLSPVVNVTLMFEYDFTPRA